VLGTTAEGAWGPVDPPQTGSEEVHVGPTAPTDEAIEVWVDTDDGGNDVLTEALADTRYVKKSGGTLTGQTRIDTTSRALGLLNSTLGDAAGAFLAPDAAGALRVTNADNSGLANVECATPIAAGHAATKGYVDGMGAWCYGYTNPYTVVGSWQALAVTGMPLNPGGYTLENNNQDIVVPEPGWYMFTVSLANEVNSRKVIAPATDGGEYQAKQYHLFDQGGMACTGARIYTANRFFRIHAFGDQNIDTCIFQIQRVG
jgi:hypothetical protein